MEFKPISINEIRPFIRCGINTTSLLNASFVVPLEHRFFLVESGTANLKVEGKIYNLQKDDIVYIGSGVPYKMDAQDANVLVAYFDLTMENSDHREKIKPVGVRDIGKIENVPDYISKYYICKHRLVDVNNKNSEIRFLYTSKNLSVGKWCNELRKILVDDSIDESARNIASALMIIIITKMLNSVEFLSEYDLAVKLAKNVLEYIQKNYFDSELSLEVLALKFNYHKNYLGRCFKKEVGLPIHKYLLEYRLEKAKKLLMYSDLSLIEISEKCGFKSYKSFSNHFKKMYSILPSKILDVNKISSV